MTRLLTAMWLTLLIATGFIAINAQLDRQARRDPAYADSVLPPFRSFAQAVVVAHEVRDGPATRALADARQLVWQRPIPAEHLTLLALAEQRTGNQEGAIGAIQLAGSRGWRDGLAQQALLALALNGEPGDAASAEAALRLTALWADGDDGQPLVQDTAAVLATPAGQHAFAARMAAGGKWTNTFLSQTAAAIAPESLAPTLAEAMRRGARFDCATIAALAARYAREGHAEAARSLTLQPCAGPAGSR